MEFTVRKRRRSADEEKRSRHEEGEKKTVWLYIQYIEGDS